MLTAWNGAPHIGTPFRRHRYVFSLSMRGQSQCSLLLDLNQKPLRCDGKIALYCCFDEWFTYRIAGREMTTSCIRCALFERTCVEQNRHLNVDMIGLQLPDTRCRVRKGLIYKHDAGPSQQYIKFPPNSPLHHITNTVYPTTTSLTSSQSTISIPYIQLPSLAS